MLHVASAHAPRSIARSPLPRPPKLPFASGIVVKLFRIAISLPFSFLRPAFIVASSCLSPSPVLPFSFPCSAFIVASFCMLRCQRNPRTPLPAFFPSPVLYVALSTQPPPPCYLPSQSLRAMSFRARHWPRRMVSCSLWCSHGARMRSCPLAQASMRLPPGLARSVKPFSCR